MSSAAEFFPIFADSIRRRTRSSIRSCSGGAYAPKGMGRFDDVLSAADADAIHAYLIDQASQLAKAPRAQPAETR